MYPLKFNPLYKNYLWGGRNLEFKLNRSIPDGLTAESWEICCRDYDMSIVSNGDLKGKLLSDIIECYKEELLGTSLFSRPYEAFPLLIKIIDANDRLSVQVHPDDCYAKKSGEKYGKTEMWYVIDAKPDAKLIYGFKDRITKEDFLEAIENNKLNSLLNEVPASKGDVFYIPAGTVHALLDGLLVAEVQQNSNTTYRISDWGRVDSFGNPRELHLNKATDVINFDFEPVPAAQIITHDNDDYYSKVLVNSDYFSVQEIQVGIRYDDTTDGSKFFIYIIIEGEGSIKYANGNNNISIGETILIPASLGSYEITGKLKMLRIFKP